MKTLAECRVGLVVKMFPRLSETFILNEILELERQGLIVTIFSLKRPTESVVQEAAKCVDATIRYLPERVWPEAGRVLRALTCVCRRFPRGFFRALMHVIRGRELNSMARGLRRFCQTCCLISEMGQIRHLHAHFATDPARLASWARMICGASFSVTTHAKDLHQGNRLISPGFRFKLSHARFVVANSRQSAADLASVWDGEPPIPIETIYNGVDLEAFPLRQGEPAEPRILYVGRLVEKKGIRHLVGACGLLRKWNVPFRCEIIGSGPLESAVRKLIEDSGLKESFKMHGSMPQTRLREHYQDAAVLALPCIIAADGDRDVLPNVLKEAMAVGVPIVTTRLGGIEELVSHEQSGLLVPPSDEPALAAALRRVLGDPELRRRFALAGRKIVEERFDMHANFGRLKQLLAAQFEMPSGELAAEPANKAARYEPVS
ncbi:MAG TPA: glycosyltransferase [Verrucomicrobiae bacterium]|nr:glycosyltransferase [Verrucomicrobiae bacterium]